MLSKVFQFHTDLKPKLTTGIRPLCPLSRHQNPGIMLANGAGIAAAAVATSAVAPVSAREHIESRMPGFEPSYLRHLAPIMPDHWRASHVYPHRVGQNSIPRCHQNKGKFDTDGSKNTATRGCGYAPSCLQLLSSMVWLLGRGMFVCNCVLGGDVLSTRAG
eukprot:COSAG02_NODE_4301_length_5532_cov_4.804120_2_plen_161_part_00